MAKSFADWQAKAKQLGWSPAQYSLAAYKGTPHYAQGGSTATAAAKKKAAAPSGGSSGGRTAPKDYKVPTPVRSKRRFQTGFTQADPIRMDVVSNPNIANDQSKNAPSNYEVITRKETGRRYIMNTHGIRFIETRPGSNEFRPDGSGGEENSLWQNIKLQYQEQKPEPPKEEKKSGGGSRSSSSSSQQTADPITSDLDAYIASLDLGSANSSDYVNAPTATALAAQNPAEDLGVASGSGISGTVLTSGVTEETSPSVLTPVSASPTTPYAGSSTLTEGTQVVDTVNGKVYPNKTAATAAGVKAWMPKTQWDALQASE